MEYEASQSRQRDIGEKRGQPSGGISKTTQKQQSIAQAFPKVRRMIRKASGGLTFSIAMHLCRDVVLFQTVHC